MHKRHLGLTLPEMLVVIAVIALIITVVVSLTLQAHRIFARSSVHIEPQESQMLALQRMESEIRQGMLLNYVPSDPSFLEVILPEKDQETQLNKIERVPPVTGPLGLVQGQHVTFFVGKKEYLNPANSNQWVAVLDDRGDTLFRADDSVLPVNGKYTNAEALLDFSLRTEGGKPPEDYDPSDIEPRKVFEYWPANDNGTPNDTSDDLPSNDTKLIRITLSVPMVKTTARGREVVNHTLWTQFCLRNHETSQGGGSEE